MKWNTISWIWLGCAVLDLLNHSPDWRVFGCLGFSLFAIAVGDVVKAMRERRPW